MRKRIATILITSLILCNGIRADLIFSDTYNNGVKWNEFVLREDVNKYYASMSELLEIMVDTNTLTPRIEKNPTAKYIRDKNMKEQEKQNEGGN